MEKVKLSDIIQETITGEWGTDIKKDENDVYVIRTADFCNDGTINYDKVEKRNIAEKKIKEKSLVIGDIIIEKSGGTDKNPVGRVVLFDKENYKCLANNFTQVLRVKNEYYYKYIFYQLFYKYKCGATLQMFNQTTGIQNLQMKIYLNQKLNTYIKEEQIEIANKLDKVQEIIDIRKKQIEELEQLIKSQFVEMFGNENFEKKTLYDITSKITDGSHNPPSGIAENLGYMMLSSQNVINDKINYDNARYLRKEDFEKENARTDLKNGDVLLTIVGTVGRTAIISNEKNITLQRSVAVLKPIKEIKSEYLVGALKSDDVVKQLNKGAKGVAQKGIYLNDLKKLMIPVPPIELQNKFAEFVKQIDKQKFEIQKNLEEMQKLQESLMNKYFG